MTQNLTATQVKALTLIGMAGGTLYAYNGVSVTTARALERAGEVAFVERPTRARFNGRRTVYVADWYVTAK